MALLVMAMCAAVMGLLAVTGAIDYYCVFGHMQTVDVGDGQVHHICPTEMEPPFMQRGGYLIARNSTGGCFECVCEDAFGLACCDLPRSDARCTLDRS